MRLSPDAFWRMTPRELGYAIGAVVPAGNEPLERNDLDALIARFPDTGV